MKTKAEETAFQKLNKTWPNYLKKELQSFEYLLNLSEESLDFLKGMEFIKGEWLQNFNWGDLANMRITVVYKGEECHLEGYISSPDGGAYLAGRVNIALPYGNSLNEESECRYISKLLAKGCVRTALLDVDSERWNEEHANFLVESREWTKGE